MSSILIKDERKPLGGMTKEQLKNALIENLRGRVVAAYLFGSVATETFDVDSDVDIILVCETKTPFVQRAHAFLDLIDIYPAMDILVYTEAEFKKMTEDPTIGFWKSVVASLEKIV
ncbi:MAG: nucleotidyltransferase domain-containing protein [Oligoflexia bacterium]|nr:nucleotidyltransferase domain-containing protein [Oligoflexia bacterium]